MNVKIIFAIAVFFAAIISVQAVGVPFIIISYDLGFDSNDYEVRAQCQNYGDGNFIIVIDPDYVGSSEQNVIICHEIYHVINWDGSEADADDFANSIGVGFIKDAYHGIH